MNLEFHKDDCSRRGEIVRKSVDFDSKTVWEIEECSECGVKALVSSLPRQKTSLIGGGARVGVEISEV